MVTVVSLLLNSAPVCPTNESYFLLQWWSEYLKHLITGSIWKPKFLKFGFQRVWYSNGRSMGYVLCTRPTIWIPDQYIRKQVGVHFSGIEMVGLSGIEMALKNQTIWHPTYFWPCKYQTSLVFRSPLYLQTLNHDKLYYSFRSKITSGFSFYFLELTTAKPFSGSSMPHTRWFMARETLHFLGSVNLSSITSHLWRNLAKNLCPMQEFWLGPYFRWLLSTRGGICRRISGGLHR